MAENKKQDRRRKKQNIQSEIKSINIKLSELRGISECAISVDGNNVYDVFVAKDMFQ